MHKTHTYKLAQYIQIRHNTYSDMASHVVQEPCLVLLQQLVNVRATNHLYNYIPNRHNNIKY